MINKECELPIRKDIYATFRDETGDNDQKPSAATHPSLHQMLVSSCKVTLKDNVT